MKNNYIALGGLFACLHVLFLLMGKLIVGSELVLVLVLPLLSTIYTLKSDNKSVTMFVIATILVCCIFDFVLTFIYIVPSLMCGIAYGILRKKRFKELELLCVTSLIHMISITFSFFVIVLLFKEINFLNIFRTIFSLDGDELIVASLLFLFVLGFSEAFVIHLISDNELEKFTDRVEKNENVPKWFVVGAIISFVAFVVTYFMANLYSVFPMLAFSIFFIPFIVEGIINLKYKFFTISLICVFSLIAIFFTKYIEPLNYMILIIFVLSPFVINNFKYIKRKNFQKECK